MKEKFMELLRTKFNGVQDSVLQRIIKKHSTDLDETSSDDEIQGVVDGIGFQSVLDSYADSRVSEATRTAVANYEKKHGLKDGLKAEDPKPETKPMPSDAPQWAIDLAQQNAELKQTIVAMQSRSVSDGLENRVKTELSKKGVKESFYKGRSFKVENEDQVDEVVENILNDWTELKKDLLPNDVPPESFNLNAKGKTIEADIDSWAENSN